MERLLRGISITVIAVLLLPAFSGQDSFPISTHPMYASVRGDTADFVTAVGRSAEGREVGLDIHEIAGTDDPLIADQRTRSAARTGDVRELCSAIAQRLTKTRADENLTMVIVQRVIVDLRSADRSPMTVESLASCEVIP